MRFSPELQSTLQIPLRSTKAASSCCVDVRNRFPGCSRRTKKLIHSHPACSRVRCKSSPESSGGNSLECTTELSLLTSPPKGKDSPSGLFRAITSNRFETIANGHCLVNPRGVLYANRSQRLWALTVSREKWTTKVFALSPLAERAPTLRTMGLTERNQVERLVDSFVHIETTLVATRTHPISLADW